MSVTGQTGHVAFAKQTGFAVPNVTPGAYRAVKITGDSLVASNNMLVAEGEIGTGRDVTQAVPGGFSAAGAINGNLTARAAAVTLNGALGNIVADPGTPGTDVAHDEFSPFDVLPVFTVEKKVGSAARLAKELLTLRYTDVMINTLNVTASSGGLSTFSAGLIACGEQYIPTGPIAVPTYNTASNDLLVFHGGRVLRQDTSDDAGIVFDATDVDQNDTTFQSLEVVINNNVQADEYTIRPSRFLRSLTEGIRSVELNMTIVFEDFATYERYTYGQTVTHRPGYNLYMGALDFTLANWQLDPADNLLSETPNGAGANAQGVHFKVPKAAFSGLPVTLATGRIAVSTTARALKPTTGAIIVADVLPTAAGF